MADQLRVLIVDDMPDSADSVVFTLELAGMEARAVYGGRQALDVVESWIPNVAIIDLGMPGISGLELGPMLRRKFGRDIRLVAYTGWDRGPDRRAAFDAGFDAFVVKPSVPAELVAAVVGSAS